MPKFNKTVEQLATRFEKWLYVIRNLDRLDRIPEALRERIFEKLFEAAEIAKFTPEQVQSYEDSLKYYRDMNNVIDTAWEEGRGKGIEEGIEQGIKQGRVEEKLILAKKMRDNGVAIEQIMEITGLSRETIAGL